MGAAESTNGGADVTDAEDTFNGAAEVAMPTGASMPALELEHVSTEVELARMEGILDRVNADKIIGGAPVKALNFMELPTPKSTARTVMSSKSSSSLSHRFRALLSWRPMDYTDEVGTVGSRRGTRGGHNDTKVVYEGLEGLALQAALNQPSQLKAMIRAVSNLEQLNVKDHDKENGDDGRTALHWAAARGHLRCIQLLIEAGARTDVLDNHGRTPAQLADTLNQPLGRDLLVHGVPTPDPRSVTSGMFGLSLHAALNQPSQIKRLLYAGGQRLGDPDRVDSDGDRAPLHWAAARGHLRCLELLLHAGATVGLTDKDGKTAASLALECKQRAAHEMIMKWVDEHPPGAEKYEKLATIRDLNLASGLGPGSGLKFEQKKRMLAEDLPETTANMARLAPVHEHTNDVIQVC